jgi:hypothetical protein
MWATVGLSSAVSILDLVPVAGPLAGLVLTIIMLPIVAVRYDQLLELEKAKQLDTAPVSAWNYLAIVLALVGIGISGWESATQQPQPMPSPAPSAQHTI